MLRVNGGMSDGRLNGRSQPHRERRMDTALGTVVLEPWRSVLLGSGLLSVANGALFALIGLRLSARRRALDDHRPRHVRLLRRLLGGIAERRPHHHRASATSGAFAVFAAAAAITVLLLAMTDALAL